MQRQREDFINAFAKRGYTKKDSALIMDDFIYTLEEILAEGDAVMFRGFGTFSVKDIDERESISQELRSGFGFLLTRRYDSYQANSSRELYGKAPWTSKGRTWTRRTRKPDWR